MEFTRLCGQKLSRNDRGLRHECSAVERPRDRAGVTGNLNGNLWPQEGKVVGCPGLGSPRNTWI